MFNADPLFDPLFDPLSNQLFDPLSNQLSDPLSNQLCDGLCDELSGTSFWTAKPPARQEFASALLDIGTGPFSLNYNEPDANAFLGYRAFQPTPFGSYVQGGLPFPFNGSPSPPLSSTHLAPAFFTYTADPCPVVDHLGDRFNTFVPAAEQPQAHPTTTPLPAVQDSPPSGTTTKGMLRFARAGADSRWECLWDVGSGVVCGYLGTSPEIKRHMKTHPLEG